MTADALKVSSITVWQNSVTEYWCAIVVLPDRQLDLRSAYDCFDDESSAYDWALDMLSMHAELPPEPTTAECPTCQPAPWLRGR